MKKYVGISLMVCLAALFIWSCSEHKNPADNGIDNTNNTVDHAFSPAANVLQSATLHIYAIAPSMQDVSIHRIASPWSEMGVTWSSFSGNYDPEVNATFTVSTMGWQLIDVTDLVNGWHVGTYDNFGMLLDQEMASNSLTLFSSNNNTLDQPILILCWTDGNETTCDTLMPLMDSYIFSTEPEMNYGGDNHLRTGSALNSDSAFENQSLLMFDIPVIENTASIGDFIWNDENMNGIQDEGELGLPDVMVYLLDCAIIDSTNILTTLSTDTANILAMTTTDSEGHYSFEELLPGNYIVGIIPPEGYLLSPPDQGGDDEKDSDFFMANLSIDTILILAFDAGIGCIALEEGAINASVDAGFYLDDGGETGTASIGDFVWNDENMNGIQDEGELGLPDVMVYLLDCTIIDSSNILSTTSTDSIDILGMTTTDSEGHYSFDELLPGNYIVGIIPPEGYLLSPPNQGGDDEKDSDFFMPDTLLIFAFGTSTGCIALEEGAINASVDAGFYLDDGGETGMASIGDFVWNDENMNGIQDEGELGLPDVMVYLLDCATIYGPSIDTAIIVGRTTTDSEGHYSFDELLPGDYSVGIILPEGYLPSPADQGGDDEKDSDFSISMSIDSFMVFNIGAFTGCFALEEGATNASVDAGFYLDDGGETGMASIGDFVWNDENMNGIQDEGELGLPDVMVYLLECAIIDSSNILATTSTDSINILAMTTTDSEGHYSFDELLPGNYIVGIIPPEGYLLSPPDQGGDDEKDSDFFMPDPLIIFAFGTSTCCIALEEGAINASVDAGFYLDDGGETDPGCIHSKGYWKNHAGFGPQEDILSQYLPIWLGNDDGNYSIAVTTNAIAYEILSQHTYGHPNNGITKLYARLLTAKLNIACGADYSDVADVISDADAFLAEHDLNSWNGLSKADKKMICRWISALCGYGKNHTNHNHNFDNFNLPDALHWQTCIMP